MGFYERHVLPGLLTFACGRKSFRDQRAKIVPLAEGRVLEVGIGSGLNFPFYEAAKVDRVIGLDPAEELWARAARRARAVPFEIEYLPLEGERIPLAPSSVDTVLVTYTLCTIPQAVTALEGMRRVLKPGGRLLFCEHGKAPDAAVRRWQGRVNPAWGCVFGGCNLDRDIPALLHAGGFRIDRMERGYVARMPRFAGFNYWGSAVPA